MIRFYTDLGFHRGNSWQKDINLICTAARELNISADNIYIIVLSNSNGLDNDHVRTTLNQSISNKEILDPNNLPTLSHYCTLFIDTLKGILPNPHDHIFFLAGSLHPNITAQNIFENSNTLINLSNYPWISTPLSTILRKIK